MRLVGETASEMSVIIRLQNLPWNANALDIRRFFQGLSIPDGGVHIIGGEKGDAFIAFSTDEDARQAMMKDTGRINGYSIKLLLSSKTEMQNVIAAAKGGPPPPLPAASGMGVPKPVGFYDRPVIPPVGGAPVVPFVGGGGVGDVTGSGQGLRSSTGLGSLPVQYGYLGSTSQVIPAQPVGSVVRMNEPRAVQPAMQPAARSVFDARPLERPPTFTGNLQQPHAAPVDPMVPGLRPAVPGPPPVGTWTSPQPPMNRDMPPQDFGRPADIPGNQGVGFNTFSLSGREPVRMDGGNLDMNYQRNGNAYGAPESGRNFIPGVEAGRNLGGPPPDVGRPPPDVGRDFGRGERSGPLGRPGVEAGRNLGGPPPDVGRDFGRGERGGPLGRPEEQRDPGRFMGDRPSWTERDGGRQDSGPGQGWNSSGRSYGGRDLDGNSRREFPRSDVDRGMPAPDRWLENRNIGPDRGPRDILPNEGPRPGPRAVDPIDRYGPSRPPAFPEGSSSRFGPDSGPPGMGGVPDNRLRSDTRARLAPPDPGFREPPRSLMDEQLRRPPPPEQRWMEDRRGLGPPPLPGFDGRPSSPPRDRHFPGGGFPQRDEPWHNERQDFDPRQMRDPGSKFDLCVCARNFPQTFNYREIRRFFRGSEIPRDGVKLINDHQGMRTGVAFVRVVDIRSLHTALNMHGKMAADNCRISVERCTDEDFDQAVDGVPVKRPDRSRSPRSRHADENTNLTYFVVKKVPGKTEKDDVRKFFGKFRIAAEGGPFFELAYDKSQTGIALVALEEKDYDKVMTLHRNLLNGTRVDVIRIQAYEFEERSRRARQCEREGNKDAGPSKPATSSSSTRDKTKIEKQEPKPKELDHGGNPAVEDNGRRQSGADAEQRSYCIELRGIPYTAAPPLIQDFFRDMNIPAESIHILYNREHRATGIAYIEFNSFADQKKALEKNKQHMGHRFVEIRALSKVSMIEEYNRQQQKFGGTPIMSPSARSNPDRSKQGQGTLLSMQNLHFDTQLEDILEFFSGYHPIIDSIKLQYKDQQPTGDGLVAFQTAQEAESALRNKNRHVLLGKPVTLSWPKN